MGQANNKLKIQLPPTPEILNQSIETLFGELADSPKVELANEAIIKISRNLSEQGSFDQYEGQFKVNPILLKCLYHPNFEKTIKNLVTLLSKQLKSILQAKIIALVSREKFRKALNLANFCIFFSNDSLIQTVNLLSVRSDLEEQTRRLVLEYTKDSPELNAQFLEEIQREELIEIAKIFRVSLNMMIDLHLKLITRSDFTLKIIQRLTQSIFVLYCKIFFCSISEISKRQSHENAKVLLKIGAYFVGLGIEWSIASIYELGVFLLEALIVQAGQHLSNQKALPSHLFKRLPIVNHNEMMHWITNSILFALKFVKEGNTVSSKLNINRIPSFKLLSLIIKQFKPHDHQITYLLQEICLQTKTFQIQRVFIAEMAKEYTSIDGSSDIIKKYAQLGHINYNIKGANREVKISPEDVRTELQDNEDSVKKEVAQLCSKYTIQVIFQNRQITYQYSDKALWSMILYQLEEGSQIQKGQAIEMNKEGEVEEP